MEECTKDHGTLTKGTEKAMNDSATVISTLVTTSTVESVARGYTPGKIKTPTMENGQMESSTGMVSGKELLETVTSDNGFKIKRTAMVSMSGQTEIDMKVNGSTA